MKTIIFLGVIGLIAYVLTKFFAKEPIIPNKKKKGTQSSKATTQQLKGKIKSKGKEATVTNLQPETFRDFLNEIGNVVDHMICLRNNEFVLIAEVQPVNYFLLSPYEQDAIDAMFERWTAQLDYNIKIYIQNRYMDLSAPIEEIQKNMKESEDLPENTFQYGLSMLEDLQQWQAHTPRYETKRYILFTYKVDVSKIEAESNEELEEKILNKAFQTLFRRFNTAKSALQKGKIEVEMLTTEDVIELLYYTFNRKKAVKNKFKDLRNHENLSLYVTADQDQAHIEQVKELIESDEDSERIYEKQSV